MGHSPVDDLRGAAVLAGMIKPSRQFEGVELFKKKVSMQEVVLVAPSLGEKELSFIEGFDGVVVATDSSLHVLREKGIGVDLFFTDLDGKEAILVDTNRDGVLAVVHAHGDNINRLMSVFPEMSGPVFGTCQVVPPPPLVNFGGYTDGDRALSAILESGARRVYLVGFDFENPVEKPWLYKRGDNYGGRQDGGERGTPETERVEMERGEMGGADVGTAEMEIKAGMGGLNAEMSRFLLERKRKKLAWAREIIFYLMEKHPGRIFFPALEKNQGSE